MREVNCSSSCGLYHSNSCSHYEECFGNGQKTLDIIKRPLRLLLFLIISTTIFSCKPTFEKVGKNLASGAVKGLEKDKTKIDTLLAGLISNLRENVLGDTTKQKVDSLINAVTLKLRHSADSLTTSVRDSLLSEYTALRIKRIVLEAGDGLTTTTGNLREELLGARTQFLIEQLRDDLLGDSTLMAVGAIRNELLGNQTKALVDSLLKSSIATIAKGFKEDISPQIRGTLDDTEESVKGTVKYIAWALGVLVAVLAFVTAFFWRKFSTRKKIMRILTQEINQIGDQEQYDRLTKNIKERTAKENLESTLQEILKEEQLVEQEKWVNKDKQLLKELTDNLKTKLSEKDVQDLHQTLEEKGLKGHMESIQSRY